jgi:tetratricopeptide (TPR) repeat protein
VVLALLSGPVSSLGSLSVAGAEPQPSAVPGQPGGDPAPDTAEAQRQLIQGRYEEAITATKRALQRDERYVPAMLVMAKAYYWLRKYELATSIIDIARGIDPNNAPAYNLLGFIAITRQDKISATASFKKATELKADYGNAWNNLCAQYLESKNYDGAIEAGEKAAQLLPNFYKAQLNLGSAYRGKGRYTDAEAAYRKALSMNPNYAEAWFNLGILYLDAPQMPNLDVIAKLNIAITNLTKYRDVMASRLTRDDPADGYMEDARKAIDRERKRLERVAKQKEREKAKQVPAATPAPGTTPAPAPGAPVDGTSPATAPPAAAPAAPAPATPPPG